MGIVPPARSPAAVNVGHRKHPRMSPSFHLDLLAMTSLSPRGEGGYKGFGHGPASPRGIGRPLFRTGSFYDDFAVHPPGIQRDARVANILEGELRAVARNKPALAQEGEDFV